MSNSINDFILNNKLDINNLLFNICKIYNLIEKKADKLNYNPDDPIKNWNILYGESIVRELLNTFLNL